MEKGFKKMSIFISLIGLITFIPVIFVDIEYIDVVFLCWMVIFIILIRISPYFIKKS
jgi:hypothetical protein